MKSLYFKKNIQTNLFYSILYLSCIQFIALLYTSIFRFILYVACYDDIQHLDNKWGYLKEVWYRALKFDIYITCNVLIIPAILIPILAMFNYLNKKTFFICNLYFIIAYTFVFGINIADIPYFKYFYIHLNNSIFNWAAYGGNTFNMIIAEKSYWIYFLLFIVSIITFCILLKYISSQIAKNIQQRKPFQSYISNFVIYFVFLLICYLGSKGSLSLNKNIRIYDSYFCDNIIFNQLAINPTFHFLESLNSQTPEDISLMDTETAFNIVSKELNFNIKSYSIPLNNDVDLSSSQKPNIIIILVESFSKPYINKKDKNGKLLMPYINELIDKSIYFDNFYSQGTHTNQGIASTLYSFPAIFDKFMIRAVDLDKILYSNERLVAPNRTQQKETRPPHYQGLPNDLKKEGYKNMFFLTHISTYENMGIFLTENGFDEVYGQEKYPQESIRTAWGVDDSFLFQYALSKFDAHHKESPNKPFLGTLLTIANHPPEYCPDEYKTTSDKMDECAMAYDDWCIKSFMEDAQKKEWYKNSIFIILGDHGKIINGNPPYDIPLSLNQIPLIIFSPTMPQGQEIKNVGGQIDIYPTVMGLINKKPSYQHFGIDLLNQKRKYLPFVTDNKLACISDNDLYIYNLNSKIESLYNLNTMQNIIQTHKNTADSMRIYSSSMLEVAKYLFNNNLK